MLDTYIKDTPRENRTTPKMIEMVRFHDQITDLMHAEYDAAKEVIQKTLSGVEAEELQNESERTELVGEKYQEFMQKAFSGI